MSLNWVGARDEEVLAYAKKAGWPVQSARMARQVGKCLDYPNLSRNDEREVLYRAELIEREERQLVDEWVRDSTADLKAKRDDVRERVNELFSDAAKAETALRNGDLDPVQGAQVIDGIKRELQKAQEITESIEVNAARNQAMKADPFSYLDYVHRTYGLEDRRQNLIT
jgi:hypothetical protein